MQIIWTFAIVVALLGCAPPKHVARALSTIGNSHQPYRGKPAYLAEARPLVAVNPNSDEPHNECRQHSLACDQRLRATLAGLDGQLLALSTPPRDIELQALQLSVRELEPLLVPYPDAQPEARELKETLAKLPAEAPALQSVTHERLLELSDLMRLQLAAGQ